MKFWPSDSFSMFLFDLSGKGLIYYYSISAQPFATVSSNHLGHAGEEPVLDRHKIERIGL
jgi:hypothetical protein